MYIRPMVEYASTVWDAHTRRNINKLEQVQRHSARYVTGNHDYTSSISAMVHDLEWPTLEQRRHHSCLTMLYKICNCLVDTDFTPHLTLTQSSTRGHASHFFLTPTVQLCCLVQRVPSLYYSGLECTGDGSTTFPDCWCLQELPLHWPVMSSLPLLAWLLLPAGNVAYAAAVRLSSGKTSRYQRKMKMNLKFSLKLTHPLKLVHRTVVRCGIHDLLRYVPAHDYDLRKFKTAKKLHFEIKIRSR